MAETPNPFAAPQALPAGPEELWGETPPEALLKVKTGLSMVYYSIAGMLFMALAIPVVAVMFFRDQQVDGETTQFMVLVTLGLFFLLALIGLAGKGFCLAVPQQTQANSFLMGSLVAQGIGVLGVFASYLVPLPPAATTALNLTMYVLNALSAMLFLLFMRRVALFIERRDVAGRATRTIVIGGIVTVCLVAAIAMISLGGERADGNPLVTGLPAIGGIGSLVALVMYANTVTYLRKAIVV